MAKPEPHRSQARGRGFESLPPLSREGSVDHEPERLFRIVVTGSRDWCDEAAIDNALLDVTAVVDRSVTLVQGGAYGADSIAKALAVKRGWATETFDPFWATQGKKAGPLRNRRMLDAGADIVLAFPIGRRATSPGTWDCIEAAVDRGIPVRIFPSRNLTPSDTVNSTTGGST